MRKFLFFSVFLLIAAGGVMTYQSLQANAADLHSVELSVSRLSCGSCVETIRGAVSALDGAAGVETDVAAARSYVEFNPVEISPERIAETITASGYPATILYVRNTAGTVLAGVDTDRYVARIGSRLIERETFNRYFGERMQLAETSGRPVSVKTACQDVWRSMLQQELLLNAADQFGVMVSAAEVDRLMAEKPGVDRDQVLNEMKINGYFALQYPDREPNIIEKNNLLNKLYAKTAVDIFDNNLKQQLSVGKSGSGCGGSCC